MAQTAVVIGASSGLGAAVARRLAADGLRVYAAARSFGAGKAPPEGCVPLAIDVTDEQSVRRAVEMVFDEAGSIDVLVCCAAFLTLGACEETSADELRAVMETNFIGMTRAVRAVLPSMRARGEGRIVLFSSLNGLFAVPFQGAYTASKHAIEGWAEALAIETRPFGVAVTIVEPGDCRSGSDAYRGHAAAADAENSPYRRRFLAAARKIHRDEQNGLPPEKVATAVSRLLKRRRSPRRVVVARIDQRLAAVLHDILPGKWFSGVLSWYYAPRRRCDD